MQEQQKVYMAELFGNETIDNDQLSYVNGTIFDKVVDSGTLNQQAASNTKEKFANSRS